VSPISFCCTICGVAIHSDRDSSQGSWLRQFRIGEFSSGAKALDLPLTSLVYTEVSGVGRRDNARSYPWVAPLDKGLRWNDLDYHLEASDIGWCLLKAAFDTESVPLERLLNICESLSFPLW
jgi:hypothetical protein